MKFFDKNEDPSLLLSANNLVKKYHGKEVVNIDSIRIYQNDRIGIIGSNGAGKTTLCEMLASIRMPSSGYVRYKHNLRFGMQLQESHYARGISAYNLIKLYVDVYNIDIEANELNNLIHGLELWPIIKKNMNSLSGGQKQKINVLLAILVNPDLIILDELSTGLDVLAKDAVFYFLANFLKTHEKTLILISHNMHELEKFTKHIWLMDKGKIVEKHETKAILKDYKTLENFVRTQFKQYREYLNVKNMTNIEVTEIIDKSWERKWNKQNEKRKLWLKKSQ